MYIYGLGYQQMTAYRQNLYHNIFIIGHKTASNPTTIYQLIYTAIVSKFRVSETMH